MKFLQQLITSFLILLIFFSCGKQKETAEEITYSEDTAKLVTEVTSGTIAPDAKIIVRFSGTIIPDNLIQQPVTAKVFDFEPSIDGLTRWKDTNTLEFVPNQPFEPRKAYSGTLDIAKLLPKLADKNPDPLKFQITIAGREVASVKTEFERKPNSNTNELQLIGEIKFTQSTSLADVKSKAVLLQNDKRITPEWSTIDDKTFSFKIPSVIRTTNDQKFILRIDKDALDLSGNLERELFTLPKLDQLKMLNAVVSENEENPGIMLEFSEAVDPSQNLNGLITVSPTIPIRIQQMGKIVLLNGDFESGQIYEVNVGKTLAGALGGSIQIAQKMSVKIDEIKPEIKFSSDGMYLTSENNRRLNFMSVNVRKVNLEIKKVFQNNYIHFMQSEQVASNASRNTEFDNYYVSQVGVKIVEKTLTLGDEKNVWKQHELDLGEMLDKHKGLFLIHLSFTEKDMLYGTAAERETQSRRYYYGEEYYSNPYSSGYVYSKGRIFKPLIVSDIGLTYKKAFDRHLIFATDLRTAEPMSGVVIKLMSFQNQLIDEASTNRDGVAEFSISETDVFAIQAEKSNQQSLLKLNETAWNLSTFETDGVSDAVQGSRAFIYTDRGVYRPGDAANISVIARNNNGSFPDNLPLTLKIFNPNNQLVFEETQRQAYEGFYNFRYQGEENDLTGNYSVRAKVGSSEFYHTLKIETVVPFRLKVEVETSKEAYENTDRNLSATLIGKYLFGNPASNLQADLSISINESAVNLSKYKNFIFTNSTSDFQPIDAQIYNGKLNSAGEADIDWQFPDFSNAPGVLNASLAARVFEKGGRPNTSVKSVKIYPFENYVGIQKPELEWNSARVGSELVIPFVLVNKNGTSVPGKELTYRIYRSTRYWWWQYANNNSAQMRFKTLSSTRLVKKETLTSQSLVSNFTFNPEQNGTYLIEVQDGDQGHVASFFLNASGWGDESGSNNSDVLALNTDKKSYIVGETATVKFPAPKTGRILFSIEKGESVISYQWLDPNGDGTMEIPVKITEEMLPTAYASISIIQPHSQTANDRPIRTYGVVPLEIQKNNTKQKIEISLPESLRPKEKFTVNLATSDNQRSQFTIAVVDEGLLALTNFKTPDAWSHFYQKIRLGVSTYDIFNHVIDANKGDIFQTFSIGGGMDAYRDSQLPTSDKKRFEPVALFKGPIYTDDNGRASVTFEMPNYIGAVRVMVVNADGDRYGSAEKTVPVKSELMVQQTLPRLLGPGDEFTLPVTIFGMVENIGDVKVNVEIDGPITPLSGLTEDLTFTKISDSSINFRLKVDKEVGNAKIKIRAKSAKYEAESETNLRIRASSTRISEVVSERLEKGKRISILVPDKGIKGTNRASISISSRPNLSFNKHLYYLIRYPYGCIEQTTSAIFPQLYLKNVLKASEDSGFRSMDAKAIDERINAGIERLKLFVLPSGGFSYWPGSNDASSWGSLYAGHF